MYGNTVAGAKPPNLYDRQYFRLEHWLYMTNVTNSTTDKQVSEHMWVLGINFILLDSCIPEAEEESKLDVISIVPYSRKISWIGQPESFQIYSSKPKPNTNFPACAYVHT